MPDSIHGASGSLAFPALRTPGAWESVFEGAAAEALEGVLPQFMLPKRWFGSKARPIRGVRILETITILPDARFALLCVEFAEGDDETYVLPVAFAAGAAGQALAQERPSAVIASLEAGSETGVLYDAVWEPRFCAALLDTISEGRVFRGSTVDLVSSAAALLPRLRGEVGQPLPPVLLGVEQSNTSVRFGDRLILKLYRRLQAGINPDHEIGQFLTEKAAFAGIPPLAGVLEFHSREPDGAEPVTLALLQGFVPNHGDAWRYTLDSLGDYFTAAIGHDSTAKDRLAPPRATLLELVKDPIPLAAERLVGPYLESARLLGRRTAELHLALASDPGDPAFAPEPFTAEFQAYLHQSMRDLTGRIMGLLRDRLESLPAADQDDARRVLSLEQRIGRRFDALLTRPIQALRSRIHGDYHLGQVLYTGDDFVITDFEGEPARPLNERKMKRSPLQDVAGMLRSFHYAAYAAYFSLAQAGEPPAELEPWVRAWHVWVSVAYLKAYLDMADRAPFIPAAREELGLLLDVNLVEKGVYELGYELNNRPSWSRIPLQGILQTVQAG